MRASILSEALVVTVLVSATAVCAVLAGTAWPGFAGTPLPPIPAGFVPAGTSMSNSLATGTLATGTLATGTLATGNWPTASWATGSVPILARDPPAVVAQAGPGIADASHVPLAVDRLGALDLGVDPATSLGATGLRRADGARPLAGGAGSTDTRADAFQTERTDLPSYFLKERVVAPHKSPDVAVGLNERSSLGFYGEVVRQEREDVRNNPVRETRDIGAGISFQYKFDSR